MRTISAFRRAPPGDITEDAGPLEQLDHGREARAQMQNALQADRRRDAARRIQTDAGGAGGSVKERLLAAMFRNNRRHNGRITTDQACLGHQNYLQVVYPAQAGLTGKRHKV